MLLRWLRGLAVITAVALYLAAAVVCGQLLDPQLPNDFTIYLDAAARAFAFTGSNPYQPFAIGSSFIYPPTALFLFGPLTVLSADVARGVWFVLSALCYVLAVGLLLAYAPRRVRPAMLGVALAFAPAGQSISIGQVNTLVLFGLVLFIEGYRRPGWRWLGDAALVAAIVIKISPVVLLAYPILRRDGARTLRLLVLLSLEVIVSVLVLGVQPWADFLAIVPGLLAGFHNGANQSPAEVLAGVFPSVRLGSLVSGLLLVSWLSLVVACRRASEPLVLGGGVLVLTLASSLVWYHHLTFLLVPALLLLTHSQSDATHRWHWPITLAALLLMQLDQPAELLGAPPAWFAAAGYVTLAGALVASFVSPAIRMGLDRAAPGRAAQVAVAPRTV